VTESEQKPYTVEESRIIRDRQAVRSRVMALVLVGLCILFFAITLVKIGWMK
jgi:hypothetical protein